MKLSQLIDYFKTGPDLEVIRDEQTVKRIYERKRWAVFLTLIIGFGFFYTCRLSFSVAKKPMLDAGILDPVQMGIIGAVLLYVYAIGKFVNGILADYANIRKFMSIALFCSAILNLIFGFTSLFVLFVIIWALNGWFQSIGSAPSVVSICQWFSNKERGTRYGIWAGAHNLGEGLTFVGTSFLISMMGWRWGFIGPGIVCLLVSSIMFFNLADRPQTYGLPNVADYKKDYSAGKPLNESTGKLQRMVLKRPIIWILGLSSALMYVCRYGIHSWGPLYLQEVKDYSIVESGVIIGANTVVGLLGAVTSGLISDKFFHSRRNIPTLLYGILLTGSLTMLMLVPPGHRWLDSIAIGGFEFAIGGLIVFLAGLIAVDVMPKKAAGAVKGLIGLFSYLGAATQDWISGFLIDSGKIVTGSETNYNFDKVFYFWIGASVVSLLLACFAWNIKPQE
ncbi:MAG TPA: MFS transporter [Prolixibacteraceae bacterium]|nr:MFS transporter [Prolixibacteraceae bacterium]HCR89408.1 MFS transporter [Prolixibacteraceae bacterium]HCU60778.1 MFS transporter [Prolixibacteraceae bacterium]